MGICRLWELEGLVAVSTLVKSVVGNHYPDSHPLPPTLLGEACWWTMHPASKQRSEGEKVRVGDDLILVSVSSERYLVSNPAPTAPTALVGALGFATSLIIGSPNGSLALKSDSESLVL